MCGFAESDGTLDQKGDSADVQAHGNENLKHIFVLFLQRYTPLAPRRCASKINSEKGLTPDGRSKVALMARDGMVWLNQQSIAELFGTSIPNISIYISNIFRDKELDRNSVVKDYLTTAADGKPYHVMFYSLPMILAIGYKVKGIRGVQFRRWATEHLSEYLVKGFTMDDERLKNPDGRPDYFDELLLRIRDIRKIAPERVRPYRHFFSFLLCS